MENLYYLITALGIAAVVFALYKLLGIEQMKKWLVWAVARAEKQIGDGKGREKLMLVYSWFIEKFKLGSKFISFDLFSSWVDMALEEVKKASEK